MKENVTGHTRGIRKQLYYSSFAKGAENECIIWRKFPSLYPQLSSLKLLKGFLLNWYWSCILKAV
jgi:hypothetical protein